MTSQNSGNGSNGSQANVIAKSNGNLLRTLLDCQIRRNAQQPQYQKLLLFYVLLVLSLVNPQIPRPFHSGSIVVISYVQKTDANQVAQDPPLSLSLVSSKLQVF